MRPARAFDRGELRELERVLRSRRARLERSMERTRARRVALRMVGASAELDGASRAAGITLSTDTLEKHAELVAAIRRVEAGTYGLCVVCEMPIAYERLTHSPHATHCAECAERATPLHHPRSAD